MPDTSGAVTATDMLINIDGVGKTFTGQDGENRKSGRKGQSYLPSGQNSLAVSAR